MALFTQDGKRVDPKSIPSFKRGRAGDAERQAFFAQQREVLDVLPPRHREFFNLEQRARLKA